MRRRDLGATLALLGLAATAPAQSTPYKAVVAAPEAEVRAGPSREYPVTGTVRRGDEVVVRSESNGWLAIAPPKGSVSFVNDRFLQFPPLPPGATPVAVVLGDQVPVRVGNDKGTEPLPVEPVTLPRGSQVLLVGQKVVSNGSWWPVEPTEREVRYLPASAVAPRPTDTVVTTAGPAVTPAVAGGANTLWDQAEQAEQEGNFGTARRLYSRIFEEQSRPSGDRDLAARASRRMQALDERLQAARAGGPVPATAVSVSRPADPPPGGSVGRFVPPPASVPSPAATAPPPPSAPVAGGPSRGGTISGWLRRTGFQVDGRPTYALENTQGAFMRWYVAPQPGVSLEPYVNRAVELSGPLYYRGDLRSNFMAVNQVTLLK
jgi:hypothetical protein